MRILGIDPGLNITGYGVIDVNGRTLTLVEAGVVRGTSGKSLAHRVGEIHAGVAEVVETLRPDALALAVRTGAPVYVSEAVLDEAGSLPPSPDEESDTMDAAEIDAEVDSFRSFLDDLDPNDFIDADITDEQSPDDE